MQGAGSHRPEEPHTSSFAQDALVQRWTQRRPPDTVSTGQKQLGPHTWSAAQSVSLVHPPVPQKTQPVNAGASEQSLLPVQSLWFRQVE